MTPSQAVNAILGVWAAGWDTADGAYLFEGDAGLQSASGPLSSPPTDGPWARVTVRHTGGGQHTLGPIGGRVYRRRGRVLVQCFAPLEPAGTGRAGADGMAHAARALFEGTTASSVAFDDGQVREIGVDPAGPWYGMIADVAFTYDETK